jgi:hypothetical protein
MQPHHILGREEVGVLEPALEVEREIVRHASWSLLGCSLCWLEAVAGWMRSAK